MNWQELKKHSLTIYSTSWCPDCTRLEMILRGRDVIFKLIDIDINPDAADELKNATGKTSIPYVKIDNKFFVRGWHEEEAGLWNENVFFKEIEEQL